MFILASFTEFLAPGATIFVGLSAGALAWQQWRVAANKLKLDLFDRRYKIYDATHRYLAQVARENDTQDSAFFAFHRETAEARFLFGKEVISYLEEVSKRTVALRTMLKMLEPLPVGPERTRLAEAEGREVRWCAHQLTDMEGVFSRYLDFSKVR